MIRVRVVLDTSGLTELTKRLESAPRAVSVFAARVLVPGLRQREIARLRQAPPPNTQADYPLTWRSERQRRYVMAKLRQENNLPYRRTNRLAQGWDAAATPTQRGAMVNVVNPVPYADFVTGQLPERQPMFPRWYVWQDVLDETPARLTEETQRWWGDYMRGGL